MNKTPLHFPLLDTERVLSEHELAIVKEWNDLAVLEQNQIDVQWERF